MSTKNLARTVIEGGRYWGSSWFRRYANGQHRAKEREAINVFGREAEPHDVLVPRIRKNYRDFADKLGAPKRWLERQVGRPWRLVHSELFESFDTRTTAGRHIVFGHMLGWVDDGRQCRSWFEFTVDRHGILRRVPQVRYRSPHIQEPLPRGERELEAWLDGRRVDERGAELFWFTPTAAGAYRQHRRLGGEDAALWRSLPRWFRERHDLSAPPPDPRTRN